MSKCLNRRILDFLKISIETVFPTETVLLTIFLRTLPDWNKFSHSFSISKIDTPKPFATLNHCTKNLITNLMDVISLGL